MIRAIVQTTDGRMRESMAQDWDDLFTNLDTSDAESIQACVIEEADWDE